MNSDTFTKKILESRADLISDVPYFGKNKSAQEGGCGVVGLAANIGVKGKHIFEPSIQMHNRGNGKGGGIACAGLIPQQLGIDADILRDDYIIQIAVLDTDSAKDVEDSYILPYFKIDHKTGLEPVSDYRDMGLEVEPPGIVRYFVRVKELVLEKFIRENNFPFKDNNREAEDEFVYQNSFKLNNQFYASLGKKRAFVLSHARNLLVFKIVGYAEKVVQYYGLDDFQANIWIAHQRYPTKGKVWHPAGAHPFIGMNEALVHNGDFANYHSVTEYLRQHNITPQFLTDTEVSVQLFDLLTRVYKYPLEYAIEAIAPTTELDFDRLPHEKQHIYKAIQRMHIQNSPDGPWFFIIARSDTDNGRLQLMGITDTSMLRPQVFALQEQDEISIGLIASEKQAIDAVLHSLNKEDPRFGTVADRYWNARGGSHTDGGAFVFNIDTHSNRSVLTCSDKFGTLIDVPAGAGYTVINDGCPVPEGTSRKIIDQITQTKEPFDAHELFNCICELIPEWSFDNLGSILKKITGTARYCNMDDYFEQVLVLFSLLIDRKYDCGNKKPGRVRQIINESINSLLDSTPLITASDNQSMFCRINWQSRSKIRDPLGKESVLVIHSDGFPPEGEDSESGLTVKAYKSGWKRFIVYGLRGQRFTGCGFGAGTGGVRIDVYGSSGDYLASGIDGMTIHVHGNAQDQLAQIMKSGQLVIYGDTGQTFMYGAKGGQVYVMGNAAGRPLINAVGRPRVIINGTCLDYLAESFMAGDPHDNGGFIVLNGMKFDERGVVSEQETPYPGSNLFSLASGGAIFMRDPHKKIIPEQLNGGEFTDLTDKDWELILPYLRNNEKYFGISIERDLLTVDGRLCLPHEVYRKIQAVRLDVL
ncbi:glutamate synthase [Elusimicrobiota bacterium]